jgi:hypothetical protein
MNFPSPPICCQNYLMFDKPIIAFEAFTAACVNCKASIAEAAFLALSAHELIAASSFFFVSSFMGF